MVQGPVPSTGIKQHDACAPALATATEAAATTARSTTAAETAATAAATRTTAATEAAATSTATTTKAAATAATAGAAPCTTGTSATSRALFGTFDYRLGLGQETLDRQHTVRRNEDRILSLEGGSHHTRLRLHSKVDLIDRPKNLIDLTNLCFVFQKDRSIEVWHMLRVGT